MPNSTSPASPVSASSQSANRFDLLAAVPADWLGPPMHLERLPAQAKFVDIAHPAPLLAMARSGRGRRWYTRGAFTRHLQTAPGMIELYDSDYQIDHGRWEGSEGELLTMLLHDSLIERLQRDETPRLHLRTRHEHFDERVRELMERLWEEARAGSPYGRLYTEGLTLALVGLLTAEPSASSKRGPWRARRFSVGEQVRLRAFIDAELGSDLSIERMAAVASMSPDHFARLFKSTFGCTPHAFVLERRIDAAARALRSEPDRSVADIASCCGFSSQSHFTDVFHRRSGTTPGRWRLEA